MPKDDSNGGTGFDVQVIPVATGAASGQLNIPSASQIGNGVAVIPLPQLAQMSPMPQQAQGPAVILITMGGKKDDEDEERRRKEKEQEKAEKAKREKEKKTSSVFHRL